MNAFARIVNAKHPEPQLATRLGEYQWAQAVPFFALHLVPFAALWTGVRLQDWLLCGALYFVRMFGVTGAYHRYFAHRTYKTSRVFQFMLAFLAQTSVQKGALWWAAHHRTHHKFSDMPGDPHNSRRGFWYSHVGWILDRTGRTDYSKVRDLAKFPELVLLNEYPHIASVSLGVAVWWFFGWSGLFIGFGLSTVLLWHGTFTINSLSHMLGTQRYAAGDDSKNNFWLALITLGEGWHNNHHHFMGSTRQGFFWWEVDITYYILRALAFVGLVWDLKPPPARVYDPASWITAPRSGASETEAVPPLPSALPPTA